MNVRLLMSSAALCIVTACSDPAATSDTVGSDTTVSDTPDTPDTPDTIVATDALDAVTPVTHPGFQVVGTELHDANGVPFVMRGVNNPHIWWDATAWTALDAIAQAGANTVRVVWQTSGEPARLQEILARAVALRLVPVIELHDVTGSSDPDALDEVVDYWLRADVVAVLDAFRREALVNIANEWGSQSLSKTTWRDSYIAAIDRLRAGGIAHTLVIDGAGWGQDIDAILDEGAAVMAADPNHNVLFSVHMYGAWNEPERIAADLAKVHAAGLPIIVGEFGWDYAEGINNLFCRVDAPRLLAETRALAIGWLAWSWFGNNSENAWLDLSDDGDLDTLTSWGALIVDGSDGLRATAQSATIFADAPE